MYFGVVGLPKEENSKSNFKVTQNPP